MKGLPTGLYCVGLDYHVGYLYIVKNRLCFIHSNYFFNQVMAEDAELSNCFQSEQYVLAPITNNKELMINWLSQTTLAIHLD